MLMFLQMVKTSSCINTYIYSGKFQDYDKDCEVLMKAYAQMKGGPKKQEALASFTQSHSQQREQLLATDKVCS